MNEERSVNENAVKSEDILLKIEDLSVGFRIGKKMVNAVEGLSLEVRKGETLGLVGESGSGKSVTVTSILKLLPSNAVISNSRIIYKGRDLVLLSEKEMQKIRGNEISMIFQDPMTNLNPVFTVENQLVEAIQIHQKISKNEAKKRAVELLDMVGIKDPEKKIKNLSSYSNTSIRILRKSNKIFLPKRFRKGKPITLSTISGSTLFNALTGARQHVGNWPGKTIKKKEGSFKYRGKTYTLLDLPGTL